jgi:hypothetical protein
VLIGPLPGPLARCGAPECADGAVSGSTDAGAAQFGPPSEPFPAERARHGGRRPPDTETRSGWTAPREPGEVRAGRSANRCVADGSRVEGLDSASCRRKHRANRVGSAALSRTNRVGLDCLALEGHLTAGLILAADNHAVHLLGARVEHRRDLLRRLGYHPVGEQIVGHGAAADSHRGDHPADGVTTIRRVQPRPR